MMGNDLLTLDKLTLKEPLFMFSPISSHYLSVSPSLLITNKLNNICKHLNNICKHLNQKKNSYEITCVWQLQSRIQPIWLMTHLSILKRY